MLVSSGELPVKASSGWETMRVVHGLLRTALKGGSVVVQEIADATHVKEI